MKEQSRRKLKITAKQQQARDAVDKFMKHFKYPPTYRDVAAIIKVASSNTAYYRLRGYRHKMIRTELPSN